MGVLAREVSAATYVNLMDQYRPCYRAARYPPLYRPLAAAEYTQALVEARAPGLHRFDRPRRR
jgi:putative pyruvate formate lyase activating enzyme